LGQAWYSEIQTLWFAQEFIFANNELGKWLVHIIFGLPFLNSIIVRDCFIDSSTAKKTENNKINEFCNYKVPNYIKYTSNYVSLVFGLVLVLIQVLLQKLEKVSVLNSTQIVIIIITQIFKIIEVVKMFQTNTYIKIRTSDFNRPQKISKKTLYNIWTRFNKKLIGLFLCKTKTNKF